MQVKNEFENEKKENYEEKNEAKSKKQKARSHKLTWMINPAKSFIVLAS